MSGCAAIDALRVTTTIWTGRWRRLQEKTCLQLNNRIRLYPQCSLQSLTRPRDGPIHCSIVFLTDGPPIPKTIRRQSRMASGDEHDR